MIDVTCSNCGQVNQVNEKTCKQFLSGFDLGDGYYWARACRQCQWEALPVQPIHFKKDNHGHRTDQVARSPRQG